MAIANCLFSFDIIPKKQESLRKVPGRSPKN
jgi:hypothetical protein